MVLRVHVQVLRLFFHCDNVCLIVVYSGQLYTGKLDPDDEGMYMCSSTTREFKDLRMLIHVDAAAARLLKSEPRDEKVPLVKLEAGSGTLYCL